MKTHSTRYFVRDREIFEIERFEIKGGILPRAPTNVQGIELRVRDREIFEIEGSRDKEILLYFDLNLRFKNVKILIKIPKIIQLENQLKELFTVQNSNPTADFTQGTPSIVRKRELFF